MLEHPNESGQQMLGEKTPVTSGEKKKKKGCNFFYLKKKSLDYFFICKHFSKCSRGHCQERAGQILT